MHTVEKKEALGAATPSTVNHQPINRKETNMSHSNRVHLKEQALPSYLTQTSVTEEKPNEFAPVNVIQPMFMHFEIREKKSGEGTYKYPRFDMEGILRLPTNKQVAVVTDELQLAMSVSGQEFASSVFASQLEWALRKPSREALNFIAYRAYRGDDVKGDIERLADSIEMAFEGQQTLVDVTRIIGKSDVSIHGFHTHYKQGDLAQAEEYTGSAELTEDEMSAEELMHVYAQRELMHKKEAWSSVLGSDNAGSGIDPRISKEEWIAELSQRSPDEWEEQASYGAWAKARKVLDMVISGGQFKLGLEMMGQFKAKPLSFYLRAKRRIWDLKATEISTYSRIDYIASQQSQNDNGVNYLGESNAGSITTASMLNAKLDDEIEELQMKIRDLKGGIAQLELVVDLFSPLFEVARLDDELIKFNHYECYLTFDPFQEAVKQVALMFERTGKRFTYEDKKQAIALVKRELQGASLEALEGGMYHLFWEKEMPVEDTLERIRRVRVLRYKHDLRTGGFRKDEIEALKKAYAMRNKKQFILDDVVDSFDA